MKRMMFLLLIINIVSCDVGSKKHSDDERGQGGTSTAELNTDEDADSDYDGVFDSEEISRGSNPYVADLPLVKLFDIKNVNLSIGFQQETGELVTSFPIQFSQKKTIEKNLRPFNEIFNRRVYQKSLNVIHNKIFSKQINLEDFPNISDFLSTELGCINKATRVSTDKSLKSFYEHLDFKNLKLDFEYKYQFSNIEGVTELSKIESFVDIKQKYQDIELSPVSVRGYQEYFNFSKINNLRYMKNFSASEKIREDIGFDDFNPSFECLQYRVDNFTFKRSGQEHKFQDIRSNIESNNAQIMISYNDNSYWLSINPQKYKSVVEFLKSIDLPIKINDQKEITQFINKASEFEITDLVLNPKNSSGNKKRWFFTSTQGENVTTAIQAGQLYYLTYASDLDVLKSSNYKEVIFDGYLEDELYLDEMYPGDELEIDASIESKLNMDASSSGIFAGHEQHCQVRGSSNPRHKKGILCERYGWVNVSNGCKYTEENKNPSDQNWTKFFPISRSEKSLILNVNNQNLNASSLKQYPNLTYLLEVKSNENFQDRLNLKLKKMTDTTYSYQRVRKEVNYNGDKKCKAGERSYEIKKQAKRQIRMKIKITREGMQR